MDGTFKHWLHIQLLIFNADVLKKEISIWYLAHVDYSLIWIEE